MHSHSDRAIRIIESKTIGVIKSCLEKSIFKPIRKQAPSEIEKEVWRLISKKMISGVHAVFQFRSPNFKLAGILPCFENCGTYFTVSIL